MNGVDFAKGSKYLGDILTWETFQSGIVQFSPTCDMDTHSMAKRRYFGTFCLALLYIFPALVYRSVESEALIAYSTKVHQYHDWLLDRDGTSISHFNAGIEGGVVPVSSMSACDTSACLDSRTCCLLWHASNAHACCTPMGWALTMEAATTETQTNYLPQAQ